ncbi:hypothetical protein TWF694_005266 [Orbilia ellipsospora]|uniref:Uncharacterized protein n=1 Tax=Orbilia ellipsospora TaxID=2528407 RepID=A0AAV9WSS2_9PEZI
MRVLVGCLILGQLGSTAFIPTGTELTDDAAIDYWFPGTPNLDISPAYPPGIFDENDDFGLLKNLDAEIAADDDISLSGDDLFDSIVADLEAEKDAENDLATDDGVTWTPDYQWNTESSTEPIGPPPGLQVADGGATWMNPVSGLHPLSDISGLDTLRAQPRRRPMFGNRGPVLPEIPESEDEYVDFDSDILPPQPTDQNEDLDEFYGIPPTIGSFNDLAAEYDPLEAEVDALLDEAYVTPQSSFVTPKSESLNILGGLTWSDEEFKGMGNLDWVEDYSPWEYSEPEPEVEDPSEYMYMPGTNELDDIQAEEFQLDLELERLELERQEILARKAALAAMRLNLSPV